MSLQFYALIDEIASFMTQWVAWGGVHVAAHENFPFVATAVPIDAIGEYARRERLTMFVFSERPIDVSVTSRMDLLTTSHEPLSLRIGRLHDGCLEESFFSTMVATPLWRRYARVVRKFTTAGMAGVVLDSGNPISPTHYLRYSEGAARAEAAGTPLKMFAQAPYRFFPTK